MANHWLSRCGTASGFDMTAVFSLLPRFRPGAAAASSCHQLWSSPRHSTGGRRSVSGSAARYAEVKPFDDMPGPKPLPLIGNAWRFLPVIGEFFGISFKDLSSYMYNKYGPVTKISGIPGKPPIMHVFLPEDMEAVFRNEGQWPIRAGMATLAYYRNVLKKEYYQGITGILIENGPRWMEARTKVNPAMMQPRISIKYIPPIADVAQEFVDKMKLMRDQNNEMPPDFMNELFKWALESISYVALDTRLGCLAENLPADSEAQKMIDAVGDFFDCLYYLEMGLPVWKFYSSSTWKKFVSALDTFLDTSVKYVDEAVERSKTRKAQGIEREGEPSVLERLLERASPKEAALMAQEMIFGGVDTSSYTMASAIYCLSKNQDKQELLFQELKKFLPKKNDTIKEEYLEDMKYLKGCLKEVFRLASPFQGNARVTAKETVIRNYKVPPGVMVIMPSHISHISEEYYPQSKRFVPERWLKSRPTTDTIGSVEDFDAVSIRKPPPFGFLPFGFGPRSCVGKRFAEMELNILLIKIFRNFKVEYNYGEMTYVTKIMNTPKDPLRFKLTERKE